MAMVSCNEMCCHPHFSTRLPEHYSNSPLHLLRTSAPLVDLPAPRLKKALPRYCIFQACTASLQPPPPSPASKVYSALQTTRFTHHLFGSGRISGAVRAASKAGGDVLHVVFSTHWVKDVLRAVAPTRCLNLLLGTQCTAKKEEKKI